MDSPLLLVGVGIVIVIVVVVILFISSRSNRDIVEERLDRETHAVLDSFAELEEGEEAPTSEQRKKRFENLDTALSERNFGKNWRAKLAKADLKLTVGEFAVIHILSIGGFFSVAFFLLGQGLIFSLVAGLIGFFAPRIYVGRKISGRLHAFEDQLADTLSLWVNALRSGYSVLQAMEAIAKDAPEPTQTEFKRVVREVQLGIDMTDALDHLLDRVESEDLDLVVTAVNIQREVGGNLAEILDTITGTIRERIKLKGEVRVMTSQGRITGNLISFLPIILALFLNLINPGFMGPMFSDQLCGWPMLGCGLALIGIGTSVINKIVDIEI
jgi:tight adherence protein B